MEHNEALEKMMAERYLLGELLEEDRDAFEEHFFGCTECADAVRHGAAMIDSGRAITREQKSAAPSRSRRMAWLPAAAAVAITVLGYQGVVLPRLTAELDRARAPRVAVLQDLTVVASTTRGERPPEGTPTPETTLTAAAHQPLRLSLELNAQASFAGYRCTMIGAPGAAGRPLVVPAHPGRDEEMVVFPAGLDPGSYELRIEGLPHQGAPVAIATYRLDVH